MPKSVPGVGIGKASISALSSDASVLARREAQTTLSI